MQSKHLAGVIAGLATFGAAASVASAAPVTVNVRVEGPTRTVFDGPVTTDVRPFAFTSDGVQHTCDGTAANSGPQTTPAPTGGAALALASQTAPFETKGVWYDGFGPSIDFIGGEDVRYDVTTKRYLAEFYNGKFQTDLGSCGQAVGTGDSYLFAYGTGSEKVLQLAGPTTVPPGSAATLTVTDGGDGSAIAGAAAGGSTSGADGKVTTPALTARGPQTFKATKTGAIRSNAVTVCVSDGADGFCGTKAPGATTSTTAAPAAAPAAPVVPDRAAAFAKLRFVTEGAQYGRGRGPRTLAGTVDPDGSGVKDVRLRLSRTSDGACSRYDGTTERFVTTRRCGVRNARSFSVGSGTSFSYLLPAALPAGRYVLDVIVRDRAGNQTASYQRGRNRVVFVVG